MLRFNSVLQESLFLWLVLAIPVTGIAQTLDIDSKKSWQKYTYELTNTQLGVNDYNGGHFALFANGALLLSRPDTSKPFIKSSAFESKGSWTSKWLSRSSTDKNITVTANLKVYGQPQDISTGWIKFSGNPLIASKGHKHATQQSLMMDTELEGNDPSLVRGTGKYQGKWLLVFNVGPWASGGWAMAVADSLSPLKSGKNPFSLVYPFPLYTADGRHAPNDLIQVNGQWFAPDEARNRRTYMWTTSDFANWNNEGRIRGVKGHDPGMTYDGESFYLFLEDGDKLQYSTAKDPLERWKSRGLALNVGDHTGDADLSFFNNEWHMFFDDGPHQDYSIGYAAASAEDFPKGWKLVNDVFGPENPDQGQLWDDPTPEGNSFGTGDPDIAIEGTTLYMTYERSIGIAWKQLNLDDDSEQEVSIQLEVDTDWDGSSDYTSEPKFITAADSNVEFNNVGKGKIRFVINLSSSNGVESPLVRELRLEY